MLPLAGSLTDSERHHSRSAYALRPMAFPSMAGY